jgi:hypothetical protein
MSTADILQQKEEEKIPETIEKEKTNMKITIIPRVIVSGGLQNQTTKDETKTETQRVFKVVVL